jgi:hypothetical protein
MHECKSIYKCTGAARRRGAEVQRHDLEASGSPPSASPRLNCYDTCAMLRHTHNLPMCTEFRIVAGAHLCMCVVITETSAHGSRHSFGCIAKSICHMNTHMRMHSGIFMHVCIHTMSKWTLAHSHSLHSRNSMYVDLLSDDTNSNGITHTKMVKNMNRDAS